MERIKKLRDGLTLELIQEKFSWFLDADIEDEIVPISYKKEWLEYQCGGFEDVIEELLQNAFYRNDDRLNWLTAQDEGEQEVEKFLDAYFSDSL